MRRADRTTAPRASRIPTAAVQPRTEVSACALIEDQHPHAHWPYFSFVAHAATWPSLPLWSATTSEQQSTSAPGVPLTWPPVRGSGSAADFA